MPYTKGKNKLLNLGLHFEAQSTFFVDLGPGYRSERSICAPLEESTPLKLSLSFFHGCWEVPQGPTPGAILGHHQHCCGHGKSELPR